MIKELKNLNKFIEYLEGTSEDEWCVNIVRTRDHSKNCLFGHLINWYYGTDYKNPVNNVWEYFEEVWATTFMVYPVNDGQNAKYRQKTPKQRCIAYLKNLNKGKERTSLQLLRDAEERSKTLQEKFLVKQ